MALALIAILGLGIYQPETEITDPTGAHLLSVVSTLVGVLYFVLSWSGGRRATVGQRLFDIQVGNAFDGHALTTIQAVKRWIGLGSFLGLLAALPSNAAYEVATLAQIILAVILVVTTASSPTRQGLHDRFANSAVVRPAGAGRRIAIAFLVILVVLIFAAILGIAALLFEGVPWATIYATVGGPV